ncbi:MAG: LAGLIDADG family homing endonuclease [Minisyncoccia bacterium]
MPVPRTLNHDFFKKWGPEMAYVLGFFAADGCMIQSNRGSHFIEFHITDREILIAIRRVLKSNHKISVRVRKNPKHKVGYRIQIGSKEMYHDLQALGMSSRKSLTLRMPDIPSKYFGHFVRGYFDGDGCVYFKKHHAKDRKKPRYVFATRFTCGSRPFVASLLTMLRRRGLQKGFILEKQNTAYELVFSHHDSVALYRIMYDTLGDSDIYLSRKYKLFTHAIETLYGKMRA